MRASNVTNGHDQAGMYEIETFDCANPKGVIICSHGNGVRRWDGEKFFYAVAEHYPEHVFLLVDQNQPYEDGCKLNDLAVMVARVQSLVDMALQNYPDVPITVLGHSMGCGVAVRLNLQHVEKVIFVAPTAGDEVAKMVRRYGKDVAAGKIVKTSDGLTKFISKEYFDSVQGVVWEKEYEKLLERYKPVYVFESGDEEIVSEARFAHRELPFAVYKVIPGAKHNLAGEPLQSLFNDLDTLI